MKPDQKIVRRVLLKEMDRIERREQFWFNCAWAMMFLWALGLAVLAVWMVVE